MKRPIPGNLSSFFLSHQWCWSFQSYPQLFCGTDIIFQTPQTRMIIRTSDLNNNLFNVRPAALAGVHELSRVTPPVPATPLGHFAAPSPAQFAQTHILFIHWGHTLAAGCHWVGTHLLCHSKQHNTFQLWWKECQIWYLLLFPQHKQLC